MVLALVTGLAQAQFFRAAWNEVEWQTKAGPFVCSLVQQVPGFGQLRLSKNGGNPPQLELLPLPEHHFASGWVQIHAQAQPWQVYAESALLAAQPVNKTGGVTLTSAQAEPLLEQLRQGRQLLFSGVPVARGGTVAGEEQQLRALVQSRQFVSEYQKYQACSAQLITYGFADVARLTLHYGRDAKDLSAKSRASLDKLARYSKADKSVLGVIVDAHSDARTDAAESDAVSQFQADLVTRYLRDKGLAEDLITTRWHGDKYPLATNATEPGRAQNRRITLRLENASTRQQLEQKIAQRQAREAEQQAKAAAAASQAATQASSTQGLTLKDLERMVESQDLRSGKQPQPATEKTSKP